METDGASYIISALLLGSASWAGMNGKMFMAEMTKCLAKRS